MNRKLVRTFSGLLTGALLLGSAGTVNAAGFDAAYYAAHNPDVAAAVGTDAEALRLHYLTFGAAEGRLANASDVPAVSFADFDAAYYAELYPDVAAVFGTDPLSLYTHYLAIGKSEGRTPSAAAAAAVKSGKSHGETDPYARFVSAGGGSKHSHHSGSNSDAGSEDSKTESGNNAAESKDNETEVNENGTEIDLDGWYVNVDVVGYDADGNKVNQSDAVYWTGSFRDIANDDGGKMMIPEGYRVRWQLYAWDYNGNEEKEIILSDQYFGPDDTSTVTVYLDDLIKAWKENCLEGSTMTEIHIVRRAYVADASGNDVGGTHNIDLLDYTFPTEEEDNGTESKDEETEIDLDGLLVYLNITCYDKNGNECASTSDAVRWVMEFRELNNGECTLEGKPIPEGYQVRVQVRWSEDTSVILADKYLNNPDMGDNSSIEICLEDLVDALKENCPDSTVTEVRAKLWSYVADEAGNEVGARHSFGYFNSTVETETSEDTPAADDLIVSTEETTAAEVSSLSEETETETDEEETEEAAGEAEETEEETEEAGETEETEKTEEVAEEAEETGEAEETAGETEEVEEEAEETGEEAGQEESAEEE